MSWRINPFTGVAEFSGSSSGTVDEAEVALKVAEIYETDGPVQVGDLVIPSPTLSETVKAINTNYNYPSAVMGVVIEIVSATQVRILHMGKLSGGLYQLAGLTFGKQLFVGANGKITTTPPVTGPLQKLGTALKSDVIFLLPSPDIINRA